MSVIKKLTCICGNVREVSTQVKLKDMQPCVKCGSKDRTYDDKWTVRLKLTDALGKEYRYNKAYSALKAEAVAHEAEQKAAKHRGERRSKDTPFTMEQAAAFFETWVASKLVEKTITSGTACMYISRLDRWIKPYFKGVDIRNLTETDIELYRTMRLTGRYMPDHTQRLKAIATPATVNRDISTIKRMTSLLYKRRLIQVDPLHGIGMLKEDNIRDQVLSPEKIQEMITECGRMGKTRDGKVFSIYKPHLRIAVLIGLNTGLRLSGVLTLKWSEINWSELEIRKVVKGGKAVRIPINPTLQSVLLTWRDAQDDITGYVIPSPSFPGRAIRISSDFGFKGMCKAIGLDDFTFHQLRHQFATYFIMKTKNLPLCSKILGHSNSYMTERYFHLIASEAKEAMDTFTI